MRVEIIWTVIAIFVLVALPTVASAETSCEEWRNCNLQHLTPNGTNGEVRAVIYWDPDIGGPLLRGLVIAGSFTKIEGITVNNIAFRSNETGEWSSLGGGLLGTVHALAVSNGEPRATRVEIVPFAWHRGRVQRVA